MSTYDVCNYIKYFHCSWQIPTVELKQCIYTLCLQSRHRNQIFAARVTAQSSQNFSIKHTGCMKVSFGVSLRRAKVGLAPTLVCLDLTQKTYLHIISESHNCAKQANVTLELGLGSSSALVSSSLDIGFFLSDIYIR